MALVGVYEKGGRKIWQGSQGKIYYYETNIIKHYPLCNLCTSEMSERKDNIHLFKGVSETTIVYHWHSSDGCLTHPLQKMFKP